MAGSRVVLNHAGMAAMLRSRSVQDEMVRRAELVAAAARASAPVRTGAYKASIHVERATTDRSVARVVSSDRKAPIIEARLGILARALDAAR